MVIVKETHRFELRVEAHYDEWRAALREFVPGRLYPTQHLLRTFDSHHAAVEALVRKWHGLFPEDPPLAWREPSLIPPRRQSRRPRQ